MNDNVTWISSTDTDRWVSCDSKIAKTSPGGIAVTIDPKTRYQEIDGFGGCFNETGWEAMQSLSEADRAMVMREFFGSDGCNFNLARMPIGASDFALDWYSLNDTPGDLAMEKFSLARDEKWLIPFIQAGRKFRPDLKVWASPWSPPAWMKTNNDYRGGNLKWDRENLSAYAHYFSKFVSAYRKLGVDLYAVHVQNEPFSAQIFPSCQWTGAQMGEFIRDFLVPRLRADGLSTEVWLGTINCGDIKLYADQALADPKTLAVTRGVGYQWDGRNAIGETASKYPSMRLMQTETECGGGQNHWEALEYTFNLVRHYLQNGANSYLYWNLVLDEHSVSTWGWRQNAMVTIDRPGKKPRFNPEHHLMKHVAHFVVPGAQRIDIRGWDDALAFENPDKSVIAVIANRTHWNERFTLNLPGRNAFDATLTAHSLNTFSLKPL